MSSEYRGYTQQPYLGAWTKDADGSGPYTVELGHSDPGPWVQLPTGAWMRADGSGPYFRDVTAGTATALFPTPV